MDEHTARQTLNDVAMREALWCWLVEQQPEVKNGRPTPMPPSDERICEDLQRILFPKQRRFLGLF